MSSWHASFPFFDLFTFGLRFQRCLYNDMPLQLFSPRNAPAQSNLEGWSPFGCGGDSPSSRPARFHVPSLRSRQQPRYPASSLLLPLTHSHPPLHSSPTMDMVMRAPEYLKSLRVGPPSRPQLDRNRASRAGELAAHLALTDLTLLLPLLIVSNTMHNSEDQALFPPASVGIRESRS